MARYPATLDLLADQAFHSGEMLGDVLGISRAAVWKQIATLKGLGFAIDSVKGRGYRLRHRFSPIDTAAIRSGLTAKQVPVDRIEHHWRIDSTNSRARQVGASRDGIGVILTEVQTAGRGRRGRSWISSTPGNLLMSVVMNLDCTPVALSGLSLVAGIAACQVLESYAIEPRLKWPNDILVDSRKLGGLLIEVSAESGGPTTVVTGIGLNLNLSDEYGAEIDQPWCSFASLPDVEVPDRSTLVVELVDSICRHYLEFLADGLPVFQSRWDHFDDLNGVDVMILRDSEQLHGIAAGITENGDLRVMVGERLVRVNSGEVSVRRIPT